MHVYQSDKGKPRSEQRKRNKGHSIIACLTASAETEHHCLTLMFLIVGLPLQEFAG